MQTDASGSTARSFDLVVWGASGFTGRLVVEYLLQRYGATGDLRWAAGGRNEEKLRAALDGCGAESGRLQIVTGDSASIDDMRRLAASARVVCTTVGPYARYGSQLVQACAENGTHYCDLSGEVQWMRAMIDRFDTLARDNGACIVHSCGFDSVPSDMGVHFLQREAMQRLGHCLSEIKFGLRAAKGGPSGGTVASLLNVVEESRADPAIARILADPYALNPAGDRSGPDGRDQAGARFDRDFGCWTAPFVMSSINTRIVRRSNAVAGFPYGRDFRYSETMLMGEGLGGRLRSGALAFGLGSFLLAAAFSPTRRVLQATVLPKTGDGPNQQQRESGYFRIWLTGRDRQGKILRATVTGDRDPGYGSTAKMLGEAAVCLATDERPADIDGGFLTPATALGEQYLARLRCNAGLSFEIND